ncbi:MAG: type III-A CRISPR-associated RAMP protein Csm4, partial [Cyanobacteria bacterium P01_G01_bin.4]
MSEWRLVRLNFGRNPTHFGETGIGLESTCERVRSDTLFGAWMGAYAKTFGKKAVEDLLGQFETAGEPPFRVSSTFVYRHQGGTYTDYLPVLADRPTDYPADDLAFAKTFRKLKYLPLSVWQRWYQGSGFSKQDQEDLKIRASNPNDDSTELAKAGCFSYTEAFKTHELPKVAIDRTTRAT